MNNKKDVQQLITKDTTLAATLLMMGYEPDTCELLSIEEPGMYMYVYTDKYALEIARDFKKFYMRVEPNEYMDAALSLCYRFHNGAEHAN